MVAQELEVKLRVAADSLKNGFYIYLLLVARCFAHYICTLEQSPIHITPRSSAEARDPFVEHMSVQLATIDTGIATAVAAVEDARSTFLEAAAFYGEAGDDTTPDSLLGTVDDFGAHFQASVDTGERQRKAKARAAAAAVARKARAEARAAKAEAEANAKAGAEAKAEAQANAGGD
jgi:hypothetical protein